MNNRESGYVVSESRALPAALWATAGSREMNNHGLELNVKGEL